MLLFFISFFISTMVTLFVVRYLSVHDKILDSDLKGVQKVHIQAVPRIGGLGIFVAVCFSSIYSACCDSNLAKDIILIISCSCIAFIGGILEDVTKCVSPTNRLLCTIIAAIFGFVFLNARIERIDFIWNSWIISYCWMSLLFTVIAVAGVAHAINIIDGFNGLASIVTTCMLLSLGYVALQVGDAFVLIMAILVIGAIVGFVIWNYPIGRIFMGDGGAYFLGFLLGELAILLVRHNPEISTWYPVLLLIYPCFETLFSVYRRFFLRHQLPSVPDRIHLHSLIFKRLVLRAVCRRDVRALVYKNSLTSPYLWMLSFIAVCPATLFWRYTQILIVCCILFICVYIWLYFRIIRFKSPYWLILRKDK